MIKLGLKNGSLEIFNLKNFEREKALYSAWYAMHDDETFKHKVFRITTGQGEKLEIPLNQIKECVFEESTYYKPKPQDIKTKVRKKKKSTV